jgi:hypothetical protein
MVSAVQACASACSLPYRLLPYEVISHSICLPKTCAEVAEGAAATIFAVIRMAQHACGHCIAALLDFH